MSHSGKCFVAPLVICYRSYKWLKRPRYTYSHDRIFKFVHLFFPESVPKMVRRNPFLPTRIRAVIRHQMPELSSRDLTCQHKRPNRLQNTTHATCAEHSTGHQINWTAGPFCTLFPVHMPEFLVLCGSQPDCRLYGAQVLICGVDRYACVCSGVVYGLIIDVFYCRHTSCTRKLEVVST